MKTVYFVIVLLLYSYQFCTAQELPSIQTDRPDQTECPFITPVNYFQFENGFSYEETDINSNKIVVPTVLTRFGINDHFELRLITELSIQDMISGFSPVLIGFKTRLFQEKGLVPTTSFIGHVSIPKVASTKLQTIYYEPQFRFTMQHTISKKQSVSYNIGSQWEGETAQLTFIYTLTTGYSFTKKFGAYLEGYGFIPQFEKPDHRLDAGITYLFTANHQLDISAGSGLSENSPTYFISLGYSFRLKI